MSLISRTLKKEDRPADEEDGEQSPSHALEVAMRLTIAIVAVFLIGVAIVSLRPDNPAPSPPVPAGPASSQPVRRVPAQRQVEPDDLAIFKARWGAPDEQRDSTLDGDRIRTLFYGDLRAGFVWDAGEWRAAGYYRMNHGQITPEEFARRMCQSASR
jgi:hypothetical protein